MTKRRRLTKENRKFIIKKMAPKKTNYWPAIILTALVLVFITFSPQIRSYFFSTQKMAFAQKIVEAENVSNTSISSVKIKNVPPAKDTAAVKPDIVSNIVNKKVDTTKQQPVKPEKIKTPPPPPKIELQILNGCGKNGITEHFRTFLENKKHKVKSIGNYKSFKIKRTFIISQKRNNAPKILANELNIPESRIKFRKANSSSNLILIIGKDYKNFPPFRK